MEVPRIARLGPALHLGTPFPTAPVLARRRIRGVSTLCLLAWIPHYLYWPWCRDADSIALMAPRVGPWVLPYRDIRSFQLSGPNVPALILGEAIRMGPHGPLLYARRHGSPVSWGRRHRVEPGRRLGLSLPGTAAIHFPGVLPGHLVPERGPAGLARSPVHDAWALLEAWPGRAHPVAFCTPGRGKRRRFDRRKAFACPLVAAMSGDVTTRGACPQTSARIIARRTILPALEWITRSPSSGRVCRCCSPDCWSILFGDSQS